MALTQSSASSQAAAMNDDSFFAGIADKLDSVFKGLETTLMRQTALIENSLKTLVKKDDDKATKIREEQEKKLADEKAKKEDPQKDKALTGAIARLNKLVEATGNHSESLFKGSMAGAAAAGAAMSTGALAVLGAMMIPVVNEFTKSLAGEMLNQIGAPQFLDSLGLDGNTLTDGFAEGLGRGTSLGLFGSIFGKKVRNVFFVGGLLSPLVESALDGIFERNEQGMIDMFGMQISDEWIGSVSSAIGIGFSAMLMSPTFLSMFKSEKFLRHATLGMGVAGALRLGVAGLAFTLADDAGNYLAGATGSEAAGDVANWAIKGAAIGSMGGIPGMLIGAIAGLTFSLATRAIEWLKDHDEEIRDQAYKKLDDLQKKLDADPNYVPTEKELVDVVGAAEAESSRRGEMALSPDERMKDETAASTADQITSEATKRQIEQTGDIDMNDFRRMFEGVLGSDAEVKDALAKMNADPSMDNVKHFLDEVMKEMPDLSKLDPESVAYAIMEKLVIKGAHPIAATSISADMIKSHTADGVKDATSGGGVLDIEKILPAQISSGDASMPADMTKADLASWLSGFEETIKVAAKAESAPVVSNPTIVMPAITIAPQTSISHGGNKSGGITLVGGGRSDLNAGYAANFGR